MIFAIERRGLGRRAYSVSPHLIAKRRRWSLPGWRSSFQSGWGRWSSVVSSFVGGSLSLLYIVAINACFFYLILVSIKFFLSQPVIFTFFASNSPLHLTPGESREGVGEQASGSVFEVSQWEH